VLKEFVAENREEIIRRCRVKVAARVNPPPTEAEIDHGVPLFLDQLVDTFLGYFVVLAEDRRWLAEQQIGGHLGNLSGEGDV